MSDDFGFWDLIVSIFWFTLLMAWISMIIHILGDIFRDSSLSGASKAMWTLFIVLVPWLGALTYILARGDSMNERARQAAIDNEARMRAQYAEPTGTQVTAELRGLAELRDSGVLSPAEYDQAKAKVLA